MGRLTEILETYFQCNNRECMLSYCDRNCNHYQRMIDKLAAYEDAEEAGLLLHIPVKIGTPVFRIVRGDVQNPHIRKTRFKIEDIGAWHKTVFESRAEAVNALYGAFKPKAGTQKEES